MAGMAAFVNAQETSGGAALTFAQQVAAQKPSAAQDQTFAMWYSFTHPHGSFDICLRPGGVMFAPGFAVGGSRWCVGADGASIALTWGKYGDYSLQVSNAAERELTGSAVNMPEQWRKMRGTRPLSPAEARLLGNGGAGSQWMFEYAGGSFPVEFRGDVYNHFVCKQYPAHSHWSLGGAGADELTINWAKYGTYTIKVDGSAGTGVGSYVGNPADWRKMTFLADLAPAVAAEQCDAHDHEHHGH